MKKITLFSALLIILTLSFASCGLFQRFCKHKYSETVVAPTCAAEGYTEHTCSICKSSYRDNQTQKVAHVYKDVVTAPTCTAEGYTEHTCSVCGDNYRDAFTQQGAHTYKVVVIPPTCTAEGYTEHTCSECGDSYTDNTQEKAPHAYLREVFPANCTAEGYTKYTCSSCGDTYNDDVIPMTSHRFNGKACEYCSIEEITETITPDTEWYNESSIAFVITTKEELAGLASLVNEGKITSDQVFYLDADIDLEFYEWIPIGTNENPFTATFKGEGYTISSLKINADCDYVGLFGKVDGSVTNLNVTNASVYVKGQHSYMGILAGYVKNEVTDVNVSGFLDAKLSSYVGGIVGSTSAQIQESSSAAIVTGMDYVGGIAGASAPASAVYSKITNTGTVTGQNYVGGIIGQLNASGSVQTDIIANTGNVSGKTEVGGIFGSANAKVGSALYGASVCADVVGDYYVGGLIGRTDSVAIQSCSNEGSAVIANSYLTEGESFYVYLGGYVGKGYKVTDCINTVSISYNSRGMYVGGIAGYLSNAIFNCENTADISGKDNIGGLVGRLETSTDISVSNLKNSGNITGNTSTGGIIGYFVVNEKVFVTLSQLENSGSITAAGDVGGIVGCYNYKGNYEHILTAADLRNTGDITVEKNNVGGLFGYSMAGNSSIIKNSYSSANILGSFKVGGLVGENLNIEIKDCSNEGSTITATGWHTDGGIDYVWLGGYVGSGYKVSGCTNNSDITYTGTGIYVGGIIGYATGEIQDCTNNGNISSHSDYVGGIAGYVKSNVALTFKNLENSGDVSGNSLSAGIIGKLNVVTNNLGTLALIERKGTYYYRYCSYHRYQEEVTLNNIVNSGNISVKDSCVSGIIASTYLESTYFKENRNCCDPSSYSGYCHYLGYLVMSSSDVKNIGSISGSSSVGELFGEFQSEGHSSIISTLTTYTVTGSITVNGELKEGDYDVASNTNLTLSGREIYTPSVEENPEETPEDGTEDTTDNGADTGSTEGEATE